VSVIKLKADLGAIEGTSADLKLKEAMYKVGEGLASTIVIDGKFKIIERNDYDFGNNVALKRAKHLTLQGNGSSSQLLPSFPTNMQSLVIGGLESLVIKDLVIAGDPTKQFDCGTLFWLTQTGHIVWDNTHVYGLASASNNPFGIVFVDNAGFTMRDSLIKGSTSVGSGLFTIQHARKTSISNVEFLDYGELDGEGGTYRSKTSYGFSHSWIKFSVPHPLGSTAYIGTPLLEQMMLDEGARYGISCDGGATRMQGLRLRDVSINLRHAGLLLNNVDSLVAEDSLFTWRGGVPAIEGTNVKRTRLTRCKATHADTGITLTGQTDKLIMEECEGFGPISVPDGTDFDTLN